MKYGDTLQQRSIPLWETYNIDYNDIKHLIKVRTTKDQAQATTIPGHENEARALQDFEDELYNELLQQHSRIDLFVQSKSGEIARRLTHLDKQVAHLVHRNILSEQTKLSVRRLERFSKTEETILKVGEDIQALSRFVGAQRLAFQKLLKKYKKWTSSSDLGHRFQKDVLDRPTSFTKKDFGSLLTQWAEVLAAVRAPFNAGPHWQPRSAEKTESILRAEEPNTRNMSRAKPVQGDILQGPLQKGQHTASNTKDIHSMCENLSNLDFDTAFTVIPVGHTACKAVYWIHPDNLIQVHVMLLQHTRLYRTNSTAPSPPNTSSPRSSRSGSINSYWSALTSRADEETGVIICDDLQRFCKCQSSATISDSENLRGNILEKAAASIRYCFTGEAIAVMGKSSHPTDRFVGERSGFVRAKLKRKAVSHLFSEDPIQPSKRRHSYQSGISNGIADRKSDTGQDIEMIRKWFCDHKDIQPLVQLHMKRTRFVGLRNSETGGVWATVDKNIAMRRCSKEALTSGDDFLTFEEEGKAGFENFPYALMEIRCEGQAATDLIVSLDESHLTERVPGFSLVTHAVATLCKAQGMPSPFWLPALNQDIRKVPAKTTRPKTASSQVSPDSARSQISSTSAGSVGEGPSGSSFSALTSDSPPTSVPDMLESSSLSAFKKKRRLRKKHPLSDQITQISKPHQQRYWNEFDDGDGESEEEVYTIFVDPNKSSTFPGADAMTKLATSIALGARASSQRVKSWLYSEPKTTSNEHAPLLNDYFAQSASVDDSDIDDDLSPESLTRGPRRRYLTFSNQRNEQARKSRESLLFRFCVVSFIASFVLLGIAAILTSTGRRKSALAVNLGVLVGVIWSLIFAIIGVGMMTAQTKNLGWIHRVAVLLILIIICVGNGVLLAILSGS